MPMSVFAFSSTALSKTMFMNWSNPRITPVTCLFAFSATAAPRKSGSSPHEQALHYLVLESLGWPGCQMYVKQALYRLHRRLCLQAM